MEIIIVENKEQLKKLENDSALTIEGLREDSFGELLEWIEKYTPLKKKTIYSIKGKVMNDVYGLSGDNAYKADLTIACVMLSDMENCGAVVIPRFEIGGRWFDDIVENNERRERSK